MIKVAIFPVLLLVSISHSREPSVTSVDYSNPSQYLEIPESLGNHDEISSLASSLKGRTDEETISRILNWMDRNLKYDPNAAYAWRNFDTVFEEKKFGGCADQGIFYGVLLKAAGIPTLWVKTMDVDWIWAFKKDRPFKSWSGHVFLEVFVDEKWMLLNPAAKSLHKDYFPAARILPGNRFAYDKGNDPEEMIMSLQWEEWKAQTRSFFRKLPESVLPVDTLGGSSLALNQAFVAGNAPYYQVLTRIAQRKGYTVIKSFNCDYEKYLPEATGHLLLIETHDGIPVVPIETLNRYFPGVDKEMASGKQTVEIKDTKIIFYDFSKPIHPPEQMGANR